MAALGGLLGAYGSDEDEALSSQESEETKTGQVTLFGDDDDAGGLSHLTGCAAARAKAEADTAAGAAQQGAAAGPRPGSAGSDQAAAMDVDGGAPAPAAGGAEQPPAAGEGAQQGQADPLALLPPEMRQPPEGEGYPDVQARIEHWLYLQRTRGRYMNEEIRKSRGYRNPEFFAKMVEHLEIDQYGTSFAPEVFDPKSLPPEDYLDALQREWAAEDERRKAARAAGQGRVEFHKSSSNPNLAQPALKPGLQPGAGAQAAGQSIAAAAAQAAARAAAAAAAAQQQQQAGAKPAAPGAGAAQNQAAALATAQAKARAAQIAAQLAAQRK
ncbi:hypothetical protein COHA_004248 [Chlorella ohadii]|uniref:Uncharacterized protein n=1 Tax=Chlorella ohadii TaxID=2649997 RepID=A0AAD5DTD0_9CHLO|nr:hypothetical protein COHA_004248 [Chlorella ohadii]